MVRFAAIGAGALRLNRMYGLVIDTVSQEPVLDKRNQLLDDTIDQMLGMVNRAHSSSSRGGSGRMIAIAGTTVVLDQSSPAFEYQLERLASAIEATIAHQRAMAMLAAADALTGPVPLWLVTGSSVLAQWLAWSRGEMALRRVLRLSDQTNIAPVAGTLHRTARVALGKFASKIRVANGVAVAERIKLPGQLPGKRSGLMALGRKAELIIPEDGEIPVTIAAGCIGRSLCTLYGHPFFTAADLVIIAARNEGRTLVLELAHKEGSLAPVPEAAKAIMPADHDRACPWRPTRREIDHLYGLVNRLRGHEHSA